jgi:acyl carrier protein
MSSHTQIRQIVADVLGVPASDVSDHAHRDSVPGWDSVNHLNIVLAIEELFDVSFDAEEIGKLTSIDAIAQRIDSGSAPT